jgi:flagellar hook-length control protein FliK
MGTPITVTTPNPGEVTAIQPASGMPAAPFDAVLALMVPEAATTGTPVAGPSSAAAPVVLPTAGTIVSPSLTAETTLPALAIPPVQPVFTAMVNAADPAEADIAALMAATSLATRGVSARPPETISPPALPASLEAVVSDDFIGPVRPPELTADPAALVADNAAGLPEAAESPAGIVPVAIIAPEDFIGPQRPADRHAAANEAQQPTRGVDDLSIEDIVSQSAPLPEAQALLQPEGETVALDQLAEPVAMPLMMAPEHGDMAKDQGLALSPVLSASAALVNAGPANANSVAHTAKNTSRNTASELHKADQISDYSPDTTGLSLSAAKPALSQGELGTLENETDTTRNGAADESALPDDMSDEALAAVLAQQTSFAAPQTIIQRTTNAQSAADQTAQAPIVRPIAIDPRMMPQPLTRDEALLRVMREIAPEKQQTAAKAERAAQRETFVNLAAAADLIADGTSGLTVATQPYAARTEPDAAGALRHALARINAERNEARHLDDAFTNEQVRTSDQEQLVVDKKLTAMIHNVTVTQGQWDGTQGTTPAANGMIQPPVAPIPAIEATTRDMAAAITVNADGRRDTKRDAEIRQRQVEQQINLALRSGTPEIRMQLYPPGLGQVIIRLALDGQKLRLSMTADNDEASNSLAQTELGLRDALSRDGYTLAGFDVHDNGENNRRHQSRADAATQPTTSPAEGDAFSVDMTA